MLKQALLLVYFSFYKVGAAANDNLRQVRHYSLRLLGMFNILVLANLAAFITAVCHVELFEYPLLLLGSVLLPQLLLPRFLFADAHWQRTFVRLDRLPFAGKLALSSFFFLSLPALLGLLIYQSVVASGRPLLL